MLPNEFDSHRQRERERMFRAVGFQFACCRNVVPYAWFGKNANVWCNAVLQTKSRANRPLQRYADVGCIEAFVRVVQDSVFVECGMDGNFHGHANISVKAQFRHGKHVVDAFYRNADIVDGLQRFTADCMAGIFFEIGNQMYVTDSCFHTKPLVQVAMRA